MSSGSRRREALPPAKLYALLAQEFELARDPACRRCAMPLPIFRPPPDPFAANWHTGAPRSCPFRCHLVIAEVQARLWTRYDMLPFEASAGPHEASREGDDVAQ